MPLWLHAFFLAPSSVSNPACSPDTLSSSVSSHLSLSSPHTFLPALAGVLVLGIGDAVASLVGSYWGRHHWPGSPKTYEGTLGEATISIDNES